MGTRRGVCGNCERLELRLAELERQLALALARIAELEGELAAARKNSSTSSKPPSSDIVKRPPASSGKPGRPRKRRPGGQPGHPRHARPPFPPEQIDRTWTYEWPEPGASRLNVDETGHPECGRQLWAWGFHAPGLHGFTWYHIDTARSSEVLLEFLGEAFTGVVGCDYHSAYRKFLRETPAAVQFCWAHLIRDVKYLTTLSDRVTRRWGEKLLGPIKQLFRLWHRRPEMSAASWQRAADKVRRAVLERGRRPPPRSEAQNVAARFRDHADQYFTFLELPNVEPTNNAMEQRFRFVAQDRKLTQGTRGETGQRWCERIWTVLATCAQQGRSAFRFLHESIHAHFNGRSYPTLLIQNP
jgi:hypothetical protein